MDYVLNNIILYYVIEEYIVDINKIIHFYNNNITNNTLEKKADKKEKKVQFEIDKEIKKDRGIR